jgi:deoxyribose-phosphate aldolase
LANIIEREAFMEDNKDEVEQNPQKARDTSEQDAKDFAEFKRIKRREEAHAMVTNIDCDCLSVYTAASTLKQFCVDANRMELGAIVVYPLAVKACVDYLGKDPKCSLIAAVSYPHGGDTLKVKIAAVKQAIKDGVDEVEVSAPISAIKDGNYSYYKKEVKKLKKAVRSIPLRVVLDCDVLSEQELIKAASIAAECNVNLIRLSKLKDIKLLSTIKSSLKTKCLLKVDGVDSYNSFKQAYIMGANVVGCDRALEIAAQILADAEKE